ncbi:hypothetical protein Patl1_36270 [Pistacia atlantica]|nr:hypothetical protein Patl1_36270 [Pistacia atlantica]
MACARRKVEPVTSNSLMEKSPHFFKVILPSTLAEKKLGIPEMFVKKFGNELPDIATLEVPNGQVWLVRLTKDGRKIWFQDGWDDFIQHHSISVGYFLVFKYVKNSTFQASDGRVMCDVQIRQVISRSFLLTKGWCRVLKEENLKQGDICVFELIKMKDFILKLSVYHAAETLI